MKNILIVLNYNDYKSCINFYNQVADYDILDKIIFVDNNSKDNSYKHLTMISSNKVDIIKTSENKGYAYGNNFGIKYAIEKYGECNIIISNPDIEVSENTLKELIDLLKTKDVIAPTVIQSGELSRGWHLPTSFDEVKLSIPKYGKNTKKILGYPDEYYQGNISKVDVVSGCFFLIKSNVIKDIGYFDENTFLYYEENILAYKLKEKGYEAFIANNLRVLHHHSVSIDKNNKRSQKFKILKSSQMYYVKNYLHINIVYLLLIKLFSFITLMYIEKESK